MYLDPSCTPEQQGTGRVPPSCAALVRLAARRGALARQQEPGEAPRIMVVVF